MKHAYDDRTFKDPVCGMEISRQTAFDEFVYEGKTYYFCAPSCRQTFEDNPEQYIRLHRQHGYRSS